MASGTTGNTEDKDADKQEKLENDTAENKDVDDDDDDEDDDEDYDPTKDTEAVPDDDDDDVDLPTSSQIVPQSSSYPEVDKVFEELFGYPWGQTVFSKPLFIANTDEKILQQQQLRRQRQEGRSARISMAGGEPYPTSNKKIKHTYDDDNNYNGNGSYNNEQILTKLFGHQAAMRILYAPKPKKQFDFPLLPSIEVSLQQGKRALQTERRRFAGMDMWVASAATAVVNHAKSTAEDAATVGNQDTNTNRAATATTFTATGMSVPFGSKISSSSTTTTTTTSTSGGGLDQVLQDIAAGPMKLSTVAKTSADWDVFKSQNTTAADLLEEHAQGKDAFLVKQDFLSRVDVRRLEQEKAQQQRHQMKR